MAKEPNTRELILDILLQVTRDDVFSHIALRQTLAAHPSLSRQERAFVTRCAEGTIERMIELDYILDSFSKTPVRKMKPVIKNILRSALYQILYMDSVPDAAACSEAVRLAAKRGFSGLKGFVNGVLRNIIRNKEQIAYPDPAAQPLQALSVRYSIPEWLLKRFIKQYGQEKCEAILREFPAERPVTVRIDPGRITEGDFIGRMRVQGITAKPVRWPALSDFGSPDRQAADKDPERIAEAGALNAPGGAFTLEGFDSLTDLPEFKEGLFYVQDIASMQAVESVDFESLLREAKGRPVRVLDVCAAPGGKSIQAAQKLRENGVVKGTVTARDLTEAKVRLIRENAARCRTEHLAAEVWDATIFDPACEEKIDLVIADLPCSGLGVLGRKTDIKYRVSEEQIAELAALQLKILRTVCRYVRPGGILLYSTCTLTPEENTENTAAFLLAHSDFTLTKEEELTPDQGGDGFYIAVMRRAAP